MKIKTTMLLGAALLLVSSVSLAAPAAAGVDSRFSQLEAELKMLEQKENERFKEEEQIAKSAQNNLNVLTRSIYSNEMKNLLKQYQGFLGEIDKQSKVEERKIFEFNQLKSLRAE